MKKQTHITIPLESFKGIIGNINTNVEVLLFIALLYRLEINEENMKIIKDQINNNKIWLSLSKSYIKKAKSL